MWFELIELSEINIYMVVVFNLQVAKNNAFVSPFYRRIFCTSLVLKSLPFPAYLKPEKGTPFGRISPNRPLHRNTPEGIIFSLTLFDVRLGYFICHCWPFSLIIWVLLDMYL